MTAFSKLWPLLLKWFDDSSHQTATDPRATPEPETEDDDETRRAVHEATREQIAWYYWSHHSPI